MAQFLTRLVLVEYDEEHWYLDEPLKYVTNRPFGFPWTICVPANSFSTDLASVPHIFRPIIRRGGTHKAAVVHDWLTYRNAHHDDKGLDNITRRDADKIFREALKVCGVPSWKVTVMYHAVRLYSLTKRSKK